MSQIAIIIGSVAALVIAYSVWGAAKVNEGRQQERARVMTEEKKIDAKAERARRAVAATPADGVLAPWERTK